MILSKEYLSHNYVSITPITGITDEVDRCYQPFVDEKWALYKGGE